MFFSVHSFGLKVIHRKPVAYQAYYNDSRRHWVSEIKEITLGQLYKTVNKLFETIEASRLKV